MELPFKIIEISIGVGFGCYFILACIGMGVNAYRFMSKNRDSSD